MNRRLWAVYAALAVLAGAAVVGMAADEASGRGTATGKAAPAADEEAQTAEQKSCVNRCNVSETKCSTEVRRARSQCSRKAASGGRDPMTGRNDYTYFCRHFDNPSRNCGTDIYSGSCQARFAQRYGLCVDTMYNNIAAMRYDCFKNERDAQNFCREELRDCRAACQ